MPRFADINRIGVWISHDMLVVPLAVYATSKKVNLRYFDTKQWINYLAGVANVATAAGMQNIEAAAGEFFGAKELALADKEYAAMIPVKGLASGTMTM